MITRLCTFIALTSLVANSASAAAPSLKTLLPSGAQRGQKVEVTISGSLGAAPVRSWCSRDDVTITVPEKGTKITVQVAENATPGLCWIRLMNAEGASELRPFAIGTLPELLDKEPNNDLEKAQAMPSSQVLVNGALASGGDVDVFAVSLKKGETLVASLAAKELLGSPMDGILQVVSPEGFVQLQNDDALGFDPQLAFTARVDGTHYVRLFAFPAAPNSSIALSGAATYIYRLTLTTGPFVDHAWPAAVTRGKSGSVTLKGWNLGESLKQFSIPDTANGESVSVHHAQLGNSLDLRIDDQPSSTELEPDGGANPIEIPFPATVTGRIATPGDVDDYAFDVKKGDRLAIRVDSRSLGQELDAMFDLKDATGKVLKHVDDPKRGEFDPTFDYVVPKDGRYSLTITDLFGHGGMRYAYRLSVNRQQPDVKLTAAADTFKLTAGTPLKIPVTIARVYGFKDDVEITATGLPEGVTATTAVSVTKDKATSKKVELELTAEKDVVIDGRFQIVGTPKGDAQTAHTATAPITGLTQTTSDLWLNVIKAAEKATTPEKK